MCIIFFYSDLTILKLKFFFSSFLWPYLIWFLWLQLVIYDTRGMGHYMAKRRGFSCFISPLLHFTHYVSLYSVCYKVHLGLLSKVYNVCLVSVCYLLSFLFLCVTFPCVTFCDRRNDRHTEQIRLIDYRLTKIANFFRVGLTLCYL